MRTSKTLGGILSILLLMLILLTAFIYGWLLGGQL